MAERPYLMGLVGSGVTPSLTPAMHMAEAHAQGLVYVYRPIDIGPLGIAPTDIGVVLDWARRLGFDGLNVTHPCKQLVVPHLDHLDAGAARLQAVNTVLFTDAGTIGHNTDRSGFATALATGLPDVEKDTVVQIGAGGAGSAVADALLDSGVARLCIVDADEGRARALAGDMSARFPGSTVSSGHPGDLPDRVPGANGIVNCTPVGMAHHPGTPLDPGLLRAELWVADIVYRPLETALLTAARATGCRTLHGGHMAVHQAADTLRLVTGRDPDVDRMLARFPALAAAG